MANFTPQEIEEMLQEFFNTVGKRQYIGARYVPMFGRRGEDTCEWDNSDAYEPLTIVIYQGNSYTSKQYVPKDIDITDVNYWVQTGNWNAQIEQYRQEVLEFDARIAANTEAIAGESGARVDADLQIMRDVANDYVPFPDSDFWPKYGTANQVLSTLTNGKTKWVDPVIPDSAVVGQYVAAWLDGHPEATTTVEDNSITKPKINTSLLNLLFSYEGNIDYNTYQTLLPTLGDAKLNSIYAITMSEQGHQTDYPISFGYGTMTLFTYGASNYKVQYIFTTDNSGKFALRRYYNNTWQNWVYSNYIPDNSIEYQKLSTSLQSVLMRYYNNVDVNTYQSQLPMLENAKVNSVWVVTMSASVHQSDYPTNCGYNTNTLITIGSSTYKMQYMIPPTFIGTYAVRRFYSNAWHDWEYYAKDLEMRRYYDINYINYASTAPTLAGVPYNSVYTISMNESQHQPDYPTEFGYGSNQLITSGTYSYRVQYMISQNADGKYAMRRYYSGSWHEWSMFVPDKNRIKITIAPSGGNYTTITEGIAAAYSLKNCDVVIKAGDYDIANELMTAYGSTYFDDVDFNNYGPVVGNNCKYYFESGANITCVLPNTASANAQNKFSPFNAGDGDYEIIGLHIYSEHCRYSFHDEMGGVGTYHHVYKDCYMHHNDTGNGYIQCIGGGLGAHGLIDIDSCVFESDTAEQTEDGIVSWHNGINSDIQSFINIKNCYFKNGHVRFSWYGTSTDISTMTVCGCSFKTTDVEERAETAQSTTENTDVISWNNEIRNA